MGVQQRQVVHGPGWPVPHNGLARLQLRLHQWVGQRALQLGAPAVTGRVQADLLHEQLHHAWVELPARAPLQLAARILGRHRLAVGPVRGHGAEGVGHAITRASSEISSPASPSG